MNRKKRSDVWLYFEKRSPTSAFCVLCKKEFKSSNNTSNLRDHLNRKHVTILQATKLIDEVEEMEQNESISIVGKFVSKLCKNLKNFSV